MKKLLILVLLSCSVLQANLIDRIKRGLEIAHIYNRVERKGLLEITDDVLASEKVDEEMKETIRSQKRRLFLFEYPSDGLMIKGYISFVPDCENHDLMLYLRGGSGLYEIRSPAHPTSFWGSNTVIGTTYRGGPSPGCDTFGGKDVADVKHLVEFLPELEKKLGVTFTQKKKIAVGFSRGGMQVFLALSRYPEFSSYFDGAASICGVLDLDQFLKCNQDIAKLLRVVLWQKMDQKWLDFRSPLANAASFPKDLPFLIIQSTHDHLVDLKAGHSMVKALKAHGANVEYHEIEGAIHCPLKAGQVILDWLGKR